MYQPGPVNECCGKFFVVAGKIKTLDQFDESFLTEGISVYEVLKVNDKTPLFAEDHIERLFSSARVAGATAWPPPTMIKESIRDLITKNFNINEGNIRLLLHFPGSLQEMPVLYSYYTSHSYPSEEQYAQGVPLTIFRAQRRFVHSKIINLDFRASVNQKIRNENAWEALLVDKDGYITEGSKSNFFMIRKNILVTAPEKDVLPGITRKYVLDICRRSGIVAEEKKIHSGETDKYDSCFITGTSPGILAVKKIESTRFKVDHPLLKKLALEYKLTVNDYIAKNKSRYNS
jgi:branched-chain amino acid aminotransferase